MRSLILLICLLITIPITNGEPLLCLSLDGGLKVEETQREVGGQIKYTDAAGGIITIAKPLGAVGTQRAPEPARKSDDYWNKILKSDSDILGKQYLSEISEPSYESTAGWLAPILYPFTWIGMREYPYETHIGFDGSIGINPGFFSGNEGNYLELAHVIPFALNGKLIQMEESLSILRSQLDEYLPVIQYIYQRPKEKAGWEEIAFIGRYKAKPALFARFRLVNYSKAPQRLTFEIYPPSEGKIEDSNGRLVITAPFPKLSGKYGQKFTASLIANEKFELANERPRWSFELPASGTKDIYMCFPGYCQDGSLTITPPELQKAFFVSLKEQKQDWERFFARGTDFQIPEPMIKDIYRGSLAKAMISVDGNEVRGSAITYEGFWPFCQFYFGRVMLETGYFDEARRYLDYFLKNKIEPSGLFAVNSRGALYQIFDAGYFLSYLADYYWYTGDDSLILQNQGAIDAVINMLQENRQTSMEKFPADDPRHGMVLGIINNDAQEEAYYYTSDAPIWSGLDHYAKALSKIAHVRGKPDVTQKAEKLQAYADDYYILLRKSFESSAIERENGKITFINIQPMPADACHPYVSIFRGNDRGINKNANERWRGFYRFHDRPRLVGSGFLTDEEIASIFEYERNYDQTVLGIRRYFECSLDDFECLNGDFQQLRLGMPREYLMKYYAYLHYILMPGWVGLEQSQVIPASGQVGRLTGTHPKWYDDARIGALDGSHATWPVAALTKNIFAFDDPNAKIVWVARGIPKHWLDKGQTAGAKRLTSMYGRFDLSIWYENKSKVLNITVTPLDNRTIPQMNISTRCPASGIPEKVEYGSSASIDCRLIAKQEIVVLKNVKEPVHLKVHYR